MLKCFGEVYLYWNVIARCICDETLQRGSSVLERHREVHLYGNIVARCICTRTLYRGASVMKRLSKLHLYWNVAASCICMETLYRCPSISRTAISRTLDDPDVFWATDPVYSNEIALFNPDSR